MSRKIFVPGKHQQEIINYERDFKRCAIWAGMGMGKTSSTLNAINHLQLHEESLTLVLAPLRVAQSTWPDEALKWENLRDIEVSAVVGDPKERAAALKKPANVFTINYENLPWLVEHFGKKWPFKNIVADESTKLKSFRLRQGGKRAAALAKVAHDHADRFIELTGTPSPNGLVDLWGQVWFLDRGLRLGRTYTGFEERWFRPDFGDFNSVKPFAHSQKEIQDKVKDICFSLDAKDYFDIDEPIKVSVMVDMPAKARAIYDKMQKEAFIEIANNEVEAFNAASKTMKCIAEGTEVLTDSGWKAIETFKSSDKLWDGVEWVSACRLLCNGYMPVVDCFGVSMTGDHKVLTQSGWVEADKVNNANASERYDRYEVRLPDGFKTSRVGEQGKMQASNMVGGMCLRQTNNYNRGESSKQQSGQEKILRVSTRRDAGGSLGHTRNDRPSRVDFLGSREGTLSQPERQGLAQLRWKGYHHVRELAKGVQSFLERNGNYLLKGFADRSHRQQSWVSAGQLPLVYPSGAVQQYPRKYMDEHIKRTDDSGHGGTRIRCKTGYGLREIEEGMERRESLNSARRVSQVYDIVNAGPRHRFTVRGKDGTPLIVHNCLQLVNGSIYVDEEHNWIETHDAKLQALESIAEEAAGMPLLVAYHFKSDLARLKKAFPKGRELDKNPQTIKDWNAGKIPMLFAHPMSAGHGLNLQDGSNIVVFFSLWWNLEEHLQIIERVGPMRQKQSGHNRAVFIYYIRVRDSIDDLLMARIETKRRVQDILLDATKNLFGA